VNGKKSFVSIMIRNYHSLSIQSQIITSTGGREESNAPPHLPKDFLTFEKISLDALVAHPQPLIRGQIASRMIEIHDSWIRDFLSTIVSNVL
jgi:hypothetical protein